MKLVEIYFWDSVFWLLYLPLSLILQLITREGTIIGIIFIGLAFTVILSLVLALIEGIIWDDWEPAIVLETTLVTPQPVVPLSSKPRRKRKITQEKSVSSETEASRQTKETQTPLEVKPDEQKEEPRTEANPTASSRIRAGDEPNPKMWTDVDLDELDADDDELVS